MSIGEFFEYARVPIRMGGRMWKVTYDDGAVRVFNRLSDVAAEPGNAHFARIERVRVRGGTREVLFVPAGKVRAPGLWYREGSLYVMCRSADGEGSDKEHYRRVEVDLEAEIARGIVRCFPGVVRPIDAEPAAASIVRGLAGGA